MGVSTITYTLSTGCYRTRAITVNPLPNPITGPSTVCQGNNITMSDLTGGGSWSVTPVTVATIGATSGIISGTPTAVTATATYLVTATNSANCSFATDDKLAGDLVNEGHLDHSIRKAIECGIPPVTAFQIATINTARHFNLRNLGAIAPRYWADFIVFDHLQQPVIRQTWKKGGAGCRERKVSRRRSRGGAAAPQHDESKLSPREFRGARAGRAHPHH